MQVQLIIGIYRQLQVFIECLEIHHHIQNLVKYLVLGIFMEHLHQLRKGYTEVYSFLHVYLYTNKNSIVLSSYLFYN